MSYDLRIWSRERVEPDEYEFNIGDYKVSIDESVEVENEDIAPEILQSFFGVKYLTSLYLQPYTNEKAIINKFIQYAEKLAKRYKGIVEYPRSVENKPLAQNLLPKNSQEDKKVMSISWYMDCKQSLSNRYESFVNLLEKYLPEALPRRYGSFEPPQYKYVQTGKEHFLSFLKTEDYPVIYCTKPIKYMF